MSETLFRTSDVGGLKPKATDPSRARIAFITQGERKHQLLLVVPLTSDFRRLTSLNKPIFLLQSHFPPPE